MVSKTTPHKAVAIYFILTQAYHKGLLSLRELSELSKYYKFHDDRGNLWCIGIGSGKWYLWSNNRWVVGYPQTDLSPLSKRQLLEAIVQ